MHENTPTNLKLLSPEELKEMPDKYKPYIARKLSEKPFSDITYNGERRVVDSETFFSMSTEDSYGRIQRTETKRIPEKEVNNMNSDSFNTLFQDLKTDMREREERSRREISEREERFKDQLSSYVQEASRREDRVISLVEGIKQDIVQSEDRISQNVQNSEQRIQATETRISDALEKLEATMATHVEHMESMKTQNLWGTFALFGGMLAIVVALIIAIN